MVEEPEVGLLAQWATFAAHRFCLAALLFGSALEYLHRCCSSIIQRSGMSALSLSGYVYGFLWKGHAIPAYAQRVTKSEGRSVG